MRVCLEESESASQKWVDFLSIIYGMYMQLHGSYAVAFVGPICTTTDAAHTTERDKPSTPIKQKNNMQDMCSALFEVSG